MKPEQLLQALIDGQITAVEFKRAAHKITGLSFWAIEGQPGQYVVEIRESGLLKAEKQMSREELEQLKPRCASWIITAAENPEFVHSGNRDQYPYEL